MYSPFSLEGKTAIVTAAGGGIGKAIAEEFIAAGAKVALLGRSASVHEVAAAMPASQAKGFIWDVTDFTAITKILDAVEQTLGPVNVLVNNAGTAIRESAEDTSEEAWDLTMNTNLKSVFLLSQNMGRRFLKRGGGKIINIASQAAVVALPDHLAYCTSKAAVVAMTRNMALEWGPSNIQVNAISPTVVLTDMGKAAWAGEVGEAMLQKIPLRRFALPEEVASAAVYLASDAASMITGQNLILDGGYTIQ